MPQLGELHPTSCLWHKEVSHLNCASVFVPFKDRRPWCPAVVAQVPQKLSCRFPQAAGARWVWRRFPRQSTPKFLGAGGKTSPVGECSKEFYFEKCNDKERKVASGYDSGIRSSATLAKKSSAGRNINRRTRLFTSSTVVTFSRGWEFFFSATSRNW